MKGKSLIEQIFLRKFARSASASLRQFKLLKIQHKILQNAKSALFAIR